MPTPRSVRLSDDALNRLGELAARRQVSVASLMERLLEEALRREEHPAITFRDGPSGRRAGLVDGPDVDEVVRALRQVQAEEPGLEPLETARSVAEVMSLSAHRVQAAIAYYADHAAEVDARIEADQRAADEAEAAWLRQQEILSGRRS